MPTNMAARFPTAAVPSWLVMLCALMLANCYGSHTTAFTTGPPAVSFTTNGVTTRSRQKSVEMSEGDQFRRQTKQPAAAEGAADGTMQTTSEGPLPPSDETLSSPLAALQEMRAAPALPEGSERYDKIGLDTGGVWRTKRYGFVPCTIFASQTTSPWLMKQETSGNIVSSWPASVLELIGPKAVLLLGAQPAVHATVRSMYDEALSAKAVLEITPFAEARLRQHTLRWEAIAQSGEEVKMFDEISKFTMEVIARCFLGDYGTGHILEDFLRLVPQVADGMLSRPRRFPWPLSKVTGFNFGSSQDARKEFDAVIQAVVSQRKAALERGETDRTAGVLDKMLEMQAQQVGRGGPREDEMEYDDAFLCDNMYNAMFAGFDTTSVTLCRVLECLATEESKEMGLVEKLLKELDGKVTAGDGGTGGVDEGVPSPSAEQQRRAPPGIFRAFPLLDAVVLESNRLSPAVASAFRVAKKDLRYNGYLIPQGEKLCWNINNGNKAESLYPEPQRFCPFRFLNGDDKRSDTMSTADAPGIDGNAARSSDGPLKAEEGKNQPRPLMFGFGRHKCPGKELAKLEIVLFLRTFLRKFDYRLVEGQNLKGKLPVNAPKDGMKMVLRMA